MKILALTLTLISMTVALSSPCNPASPSDAYQVGYAEGRFDLLLNRKPSKSSINASLKKRKHQKTAGRIRSNGQRLFTGVGMP